MNYSIKNLSPLHKFLAGMACILTAVVLNSLEKYEYLQGVLEGCGLGLELLAVVGFYQSYKLKNKSRD